MQGREDEDERMITSFLNEVQDRFPRKFSKKNFCKKKSEDLSRLRFEEQPQYIVKCCENSFSNPLRRIYNTNGKNYYTHFINCSLKGHLDTSFVNLFSAFLDFQSFT